MIKKNHAWMEKAAGKIALMGLLIQRKFASGMNRMVSGFSLSKLKFLLVVFCLVSGGISLYMVAVSLFVGDISQPKIEVNKIKVPTYYNNPVDSKGKREFYVNDHTYDQLQRYKYYMDSINLPISPGLLDSIKVIEQIYHSQKK